MAANLQASGNCVQFHSTTTAVASGVGRGATVGGSAGETPGEGSPGGEVCDEYLSWPVMFAYPQHATQDSIASFDHRNTLVVVVVVV